MKNLLKFLKHKLGFQFVLIASLSLILASCEKDNIELQTEADISELSVYDILARTDKKSDKAAPAPTDDNIVQTAQSVEGEFLILVAALEATGLAPLFQGDEQFTVFAPTDEAFRDLAGLGDDAGVEETVNALVDAFGAATVANVLKYHVTEGRRAANSVVPPRRTRTVETLLGVTFSVNTDAVITAVGSTSQIVQADVSASNGIIHVIDTVLLPINP